MSNLNSPKSMIRNVSNFASTVGSPRSLNKLSSVSSPRSKTLPFHPIFKPSGERVHSQYKELLVLLDSYKVQVSHLKNLISSMSECLIAQIHLQSANAISTLHDIEKGLISEIDSLKNEPEYASRCYFYLSKSFLEMPSLESRISEMINSINEAYSFEFTKKSPVPENIRKEYVTFFNNKRRVYSKIDLDSLVSTSNDVETCAFDSGCEIDNGILFLHGGDSNFKPTSEACFFDMYLDKIEVLPHSKYPRRSSACIKKGEKIYVFGSSHPVSKYCEAFDLKNLTWSKITQLPQDALNLTGSQVSQNLIITATGLTGFWVYNEIDSYEFIDIEASAGYKAICDKYLLTNNVLFEIHKGKDWTAHKYPCNWIAAPLSISIAFKRKGLIYFLDCKEKLYRINPVDRTLLEIRYS